MPGVYEIFVKDSFSASHALKGYDGKSAKLHGHNWAVEAVLQCSRLNKLGIGMEYKEIKKVLRDVLGKLEHTNLNEVMEFGSINPSSENLAKFIYTELSRRLNTDRIRVDQIRLFENPDCGCTFREI